MAAMAYKPAYHDSWALVIGINAYQNVSPLSYACNDADAIHSVLVNDLGFPSSNVILLKDTTATRNAIYDAFLSFSTKATNPDDRVLVFFAGHGMTLDGHSGKIGCLIPIDGDPKTYGSLLRWDDLTRNADVIPAKHILFIMDACYSGLAIQRATPPSTQRFLSDMLQRISRQVITAGKADETVADGGGPQGNNSIFTGYLLEGLQGVAADTGGILTANGLMHFVYQKVAQDPRSKQTPHYGHIDGDGDFILLSPNQQHLKAASPKDFLIKVAPEKPESSGLHSETLAKPSFAEVQGYVDPERPNFGRNQLSNNLGETRLSGLEREFVKAFSWLSLVIEPIDRTVSIDIAKELARLKNPNQTHPSLPSHLFFVFPRNARTTIDYLLLYEDVAYNNQLWGRYLRIDKRGSIEYGDSSRAVFLEHQETRCFRYVKIIGLLWEVMFFAKGLLGIAGYMGGVRYLVNLIGTRDTILTDFAEGKGKDNKQWAQPFGFGITDHLRELKCPSLNLQLSYDLILDSLDEQAARKVVDDAAAKLGLAYNHQSKPRCFNYDTDIFPWQQYENTM